MKNPYYKIPDYELEQMLLRFMREVTDLPDLGLNEFIDHGTDGRVWDSFVTRPRKWAELSSFLRDRGWTRTKKARFICYQGDGQYETMQTHRWVPPQPKAAA